MAGRWRESDADGRYSAEPVDARLARLADAQHGAVSLSQLRALGVSARAAQRRAAAGRLHRVHHGVYAVGRPRLDARGWRMAAVLACGPGAAISHRTAADELGIAPRSTALIEVTVPSGSHRSRRGIRIHRAPGLSSKDVTTVNGIACTTVARTLLDLAAVVGDHPLSTAIETAEKLRVFDGRAISAALQRAPRHPGAGRLRAGIAAWAEPPPTREQLERRAFEVFERAGLPRPRVNVLVEGHEVDFCWPDRRLIVEADSFEHHGTRAAFERDRRRDQRLRVAGWDTVRTTWRQLRDAPEELIAAVAR